MNQSIFKHTNHISIEREEDIFESAIGMLELIHREYYEITRENITTVYNGVKYGNDNILLEGVHELKESAKKFFKMVIQKIKELFSRIMMVFNRYILTIDDFIKKYKDELNEAEPNFTIETYEYTFSENIPNTSIVSDIVRDYNAEIRELENKTKADLIEENLQKSTTQYLDKIRGTIVGSTVPISSDEVFKAASKAMRNDATDKHSKTIDKVSYQKYIHDYPELKKSLKTFKKEKDRVVSILSDLDRFFSSGPITTYEQHEKRLTARHISIPDDKGVIVRDPDIEAFDTTDISKVSTFYTHKWNDCKEITNALTTALNCKMDAMNEAINTYKKVIFSGLKRSNQKKDEVR